VKDPPGASEERSSTLHGVSGDPFLGRTRDGDQGLKVIETKRGAIEPRSDLSLQEQGRANAHFMEEKEVGVEHVQEAQPPSQEVPLQCHLPNLELI
jgi:hypothetical protein